MGEYARRLLPALAAALALGPPALASAQPLWPGTVVDVSAAGEVMLPKVGVDGEGRAIAVWHEYFAPGQGRIMSARRTSSGWSPPRIVASPGTPSAPELTVDPQGYATVAWAVYSPPTSPLQVSRYSPVTDTWNLPVTLATVGYAPRVAADAEGNVLAVWIGPSGLEASRYTAATGAWGPPVAAGPPGGVPSLAVNAAGDAVVLWSAEGELVLRCFVASENAWFNIPPLPSRSTFGTAAAIDPAGNVVAVWTPYSGNPLDVSVMGAWFDRAARQWRGPIVVAPSTSVVGFSPIVVVDAAGDATAVWGAATPTGAQLQAARYTPATDVVSAPVTLGSGGYPAMAVDGAGNVFVAWPGSVNNVPAVESTRFDVLTGTWAPAVPLSDPAVSANEVHVASDPFGNATVVWTARNAAVATIQGTAWLERLGPPAIIAVTASAHTLAVEFTPPSLPDPAYGPANYEYSVDDGATWAVREPASTTSPLTIAGLTDYARYPIRIRAVNALGAGVASAPVVAIPGVGCTAPCALLATDVRGNQVTLEWQPPEVGAVPTGYVIEGGLNPGEVVASVPTGGAAPRFTFDAPTGAFFVRVHALSGSMRSGPSPEIRIVVNVPVRPSTPANLRALVDGATVTLSWTNTFDGGAPTSLWLGISGARNLGLQMPLSESVTYTNVPSGTYWLNLSAANARGVSPASNVVTLTVPSPCAGVPDAPVNFQAWTAGNTIHVSWWIPPTGPVATSYVVSVGGAYVGRFTTTGRTLSGAAGPGTYTLGVAAANACGVGPPASTQTVVIP